MSQSPNQSQQLKQIQILNDKIKSLQNQMDNLQHQNKKSLLEVKTQLQFQKNRALQFEEKYKNSIKYKNQQQNFKKIIAELDDKLSNKENQILQLIQRQQDQKTKISQLTSQLESLKNNNEINQLKQQLIKIQEAAYTEIIGKQEKINQLLQKIQQMEEDSNQKNMKQIILQLQQKYRQLQQRIEAQRSQAQQLLINKQQQLEQWRQKYQSLTERSQDRIQRLQQDIVQYQKHIQKINQQKYQQQSIQEKYYLTQDKLRKAEKKSHDLELAFKDQKNILQEAIKKLQQQIQNQKKQNQQAKNMQQKIKQLQKQIKSKNKEIQQTKNSFQRVKTQHIKKYTALQSQKKKLSQNLDIKGQQVEKLRQQIIQQANKSGNITNLPEVSAWSASGKTQSNHQTPSPLKKSSKKDMQEAINTIDKLKIDIKDKQQNVKILNNKLHQQAKEIQQLRHKLLEQSGSSARSKTQAKLLIQIQDLNSHIKKMENNLMINKLKYAQDQSYWNSKDVKNRKQKEQMQRQYKKQKSQLLERIDRMKKNTVKDKKMDYYQTSLK